MSMFKATKNLPICCMKQIRPIGIRTVWYDSILESLKLKKKFKIDKEINFPINIELSTGKEKMLEVLERKGITDPFYMEKTYPRGPATKENPCLVPSFEEFRYIGCVCEEDQSHIKFSVIHKGEDRRCECGYFFRLVDAPNLYELAYDGKGEWGNKD